MKNPKKVVFLDRDGVINDSPGPGRYVRSLKEFTFRKGALGMLATLVANGFRLVVITNQQGVGKGLIEVDELHRMHEHLCVVAARNGATIDGVHYCPHLESDGCVCRKPKPGLVFKAINALDYEIDWRGSWFVGDSARDVEAGQAAGLRTIWLSTPKERIPTPHSPTPTCVVSEMSGVAEVTCGNP